MRAPEHPLPEFTQPPRLATQEYSTASLDTPLAAVWLRAGPGRQGVFCHQGGCEHIVTVRDVRRFDPNCDPAWATAYPLQVAGLSFCSSAPAGLRRSAVRAGHLRGPCRDLLALFLVRRVLSGAALRRPGPGALHRLQGVSVLHGESRLCGTAAWRIVWDQAAPRQWGGAAVRFRV